MHRTRLLRIALGAAVLLDTFGAAGLAHAARADVGTAPSWFERTFGDATHVPTSAFPAAAPGRDMILPGSGVPTSGGAVSDQTLTPDGAILPGTTTPGGHNSGGS